MAKGANNRKRTKRNKSLEEGIQDSKPKRDKQIIPLQAKNDRQRQALKSFTERQLIILTGSAGVGKCHGKGTEILMADLSVKKVEDIVIGDYLMGDDGSPRKVLSTCYGTEELFRVSQNKGMDYVVNKSHILSLVVSQKYQGYEKGDTVNIPVSEWLELPDYVKEKVLKGYQANLEKLGTQAAPVKHPYLLGLWLGDGSSWSNGITIGNEPELIDYLNTYALEHGSDFKKWASSDTGNCATYSMAKFFTPLLRSLNLIGNKHLPKSYLLASRADRLELLAGIIDSDGYLASGGYDLTLKDTDLFYDTVMLARTLGFKVTVSDKPTKYNGSVIVYKRMHISGDLSCLPVRIPRKKAAARKQVKDVLRTGIQVESLGEGDYYGFTLDGNHLYCLADLTVTHNTEIASWWACKQWLAGEVDNIIITRPYKHLGADYGATKGDDAEKLLPFCMSILMKLKKYLGAGILKNNFKMGGFDALFVEADGIQIVPIEKIQGMSFNSRTIIIADELQNATIAQVKSLTTRAEDGCQIICCGDPYQTALKHDNGLDFIEDVIYNHPTEYAEVVEFTKDDVVRGGLAGHLVAAFEEMGKWED